MATPHSHRNHKNKFNVDLLAITIALTLAALVRFNIIPHIGF
jgi:hypothetical protein